MISVAYDVHGGTEVAAMNLITWMITVNMIVVGTQGAHAGGTASTNLGVPTAAADSVKYDHHGMKTVYEVGRRVAETAYIMKYGRENLTATKQKSETDSKNATDKEIDWDKYYQYENSFPKEHIGIEGKLATGEKAFNKFLEEMTQRKKTSGNTWGTLPDQKGFVDVWLKKRGLELLSDRELYALCPEYYNFYLKKD